MQGRRGRCGMTYTQAELRAITDQFITEITERLHRPSSDELVDAVMPTASDLAGQIATEFGDDQFITKSREIFAGRVLASTSIYLGNLTAKMRDDDTLPTVLIPELLITVLAFAGERLTREGGEAP